MKKIPLFEYAYKLPFDRIENLVNNIEEHGVLMNDRFGRETELSPNHEDVAKALNEVERAINLKKEQCGEDADPEGVYAFRLEEELQKYDYPQNHPEMFFVKLTDDGEYCPPKGNTTPPGRNSEKTKKERTSPQEKLISASLKKYCLETHEACNAKEPELNSVLGLTDDQVSLDTFSKNIKRISERYFESPKKRNTPKN